MPSLYCLVCVYYLNVSVSSRLITSFGEEIGGGGGGYRLLVMAP